MWDAILQPLGVGSLLPPQVLGVLLELSPQVWLSGDPHCVVDIKTGQHRRT